MSHQRSPAGGARVRNHAEDRCPRRFLHRALRSVGHHHAIYGAAVSLHSKRRAEDAGQNLGPAFVPSQGPSVSPIPLTPDAGLGQSVYTVNRAAGPGYVEQWNLAVQRAITNNLSVEFAYAGSHIVHLGIPDSNLNQLTAAQLAEGAPLLKTVPNPTTARYPLRVHRWKNNHQGAAHQTLSTLPEHRHLPQQQRNHQLQRC
jgi:hypothetical protein